VVATEAGTLSPAGDWVDDPANWSKDAWRLLEDALEQLVPAAESAGAVLALEAHPHTVLKTQSQVLEVFERFPSSHLQLVCDPYNYLTPELLPAQGRLTRELLERFECRFVLAHLKDVRLDGGELTRPAFGDGVFDQAPYLRFLCERRPDLAWILEHLTLDEVPDVISRARAIFR
jgi:sugar phosphate isomerase/epimerase